MFKKILFLVTLLSCFAIVSFAETTELVSKSKAKLNNLEKIKGNKESNKTAVAGAKAAEQVNKDELYWAGKDEVSDEEIGLFKTALDNIEQKNYKEGRENLKKLLDKYPKSALAEDSLSLLKEIDKQ
ncbi:hypothetical protein [Calditerrivibrio nitroreducens]|uniref:Outer membrane lipoprotein BamD-like domain-containing protein n=1 Tax=Calditerrivibrio nitroreducens (strain DSM 19672 / NBRC 101217 / Yu37-1) TaxID=768670 RepID=E4TI55_CALNY|nr:hypothetical protein [Calditerrivibrio nitroreducens]ADR18971.1 hypothetical protein Calni_1060 [Calditerrivibrio nitroreducens DSM 19672]